MDAPLFILPLATDIQTVQAQKTAIVNATPSELVRTIVYSILRSVHEAINEVLAAPNNVGNSVTVPIDPLILARPQFVRVTAYLTARGFTSVINAASLTVSW